jgi:hypothetical protein
MAHNFERVLSHSNVSDANAVSISTVSLLPDDV